MKKIQLDLMAKAFENNKLFFYAEDTIDMVETDIPKLVKEKKRK